MLDFPSSYPTWDSQRPAGRYLPWLMAYNRRPIILATILALGSAVVNALLPTVLGAALDAALTFGFGPEVKRLTLVLLALGLLAAITDAFGHLTTVYVWMRAAVSVMRSVAAHITRVGRSATAHQSTGDIIATVGTDAMHIGHFSEVVAPVLGSFATYLIITVLLLRQSVLLGLVVLIGMPLVTGFVALLISPLQTRQNRQREEQGKLTTLGADTVAGLRILRGIGGEDEFAQRYRAQSQKVRAAAVHVANVQAVLSGLRILMPALFIVFVMWLGARLALAGEISPGQLVAFYGYTTFLAMPLRQITMAFQVYTRARVGAHKTTRVLSTTPLAGRLGEADRLAKDLAPLSRGGPLFEIPEAGLTIRPGALTVLVSADQDESAALARRLARMADDAASGVLLAGRPITDYSLAEVRTRIVLAETTAELFTGTLRSQVDARQTATDQQVLDALAVADAGDVLRALGGLEGTISEKGRSLSGGQRQRVALARAICTHAEVAILVEPTSAVDAHTESRIAANLSRERAGRTTIIVSASPLVLEHAEEVIFLAGGRALATGTHRELLDAAHRGEAAALAYRAVVARSTAKEGHAPSDR
ncbi:MAG: ABC transporter ATP-binding protein [Bowdeniella nasicola]|nr:ABC transporter ATP-binding protein [Bowdeniella nasicola]